MLRRVAADAEQAVSAEQSAHGVAMTVDDVEEVCASAGFGMKRCVCVCVCVCVCGCDRWCQRAWVIGNVFHKPYDRTSVYKGTGTGECGSGRGGTGGPSAGSPDSSCA